MNSWQQPVSTEPSVGTLHFLSDANRPAAWMLNGGTSATWADAWTSAAALALVPKGVKALLIGGANLVTGDGAKDIFQTFWRKNGASDTLFDYRTISTGWVWTNLANGQTSYFYWQTAVPCDENGIVEYCNGAAGMATYASIRGYYI